MGYKQAGAVSLFLVEDLFLRISENAKFNFVAISQVHCMINLDSNARDDREVSAYMSKRVLNSVSHVSCPGI